MKRKRRKMQCPEKERVSLVRMRKLKGGSKDDGSDDNCDDDAECK